MKNIRFIICVLVFICTIAGAYARPSKGKGKTALCNPEPISVVCNIDVSSAMHGKCPDGEYFAIAWEREHNAACTIELHNADFTEYYKISFIDGNYSQELLQTLDVFTFQWRGFGEYRVVLMVTIKDSCIVGIRSDDVAWYNYACWINESLFGKDGPALIN